MSRVPVRAIFVAVGVLAAASVTAGEPDDYRLRYFGADIEREGGRPDGPVIKVKFGSGSTFTYRAIAELKNFTGLRELTLSGVSVRTGLFDAIRGMKDLEVFNMPNAPNDAEFAVVAGMPKLRELSVVAVGFGPGVTDDGVKALRDLKEMRKLRLWSKNVTDAGVKHIAGLTKLTELELVSTKVTDASIPLLATLTELERLDLTSTRVTVAGLGPLKGLKKLKEVRAGAGTNKEIVAAYTDLGLQHLLPKPPEGKLPPRIMGIESDDVAMLQANWRGVEVFRDTLTVEGSAPGKLVGGYFGDRQMEVVARVRGMKSFTLTNAPFVTEKGIAYLKSCKELTAIRLHERPLKKTILIELAALPALKILEGVSVNAADIPLLKGFKALEELRLSDNSNLTDDALAEYEKAGKIHCLVVRLDFEEKSLVNPLRPQSVAPGISFQGTKVTDKGMALLDGHPKVVWVRLGAEQSTEASAKHLVTFPALKHVDAHQVEFGEKQAGHLAKIKYLESLFGKFTPEGMRALAGCSRLRILELHDPTDECLHEVTKLSQIAVLRINGPRLTDAGIKHLKSMSRLLFLRISNADRVSGAAVREVGDALKGCELRRY